MNEKHWNDMTKEEKMVIMEEDDRKDKIVEDKYIERYPELKMMFDKSAVFIGTVCLHDEDIDCEDQLHERGLCLFMSDTFFYACADGEDIDESDILEVINIYKKHGYIGHICWAAKKRGYDPAIEYTEDLVYQGTWFELYGDLRLTINPMLENNGLDYRWSDKKLEIQPWESIE